MFGDDRIAAVLLQLSFDHQFHENCDRELLRAKIQEIMAFAIDVEQIETYTNHLVAWYVTHAFDSFVVE
ncbi:hypothetical protein [Thermobacillus sp.]|uniref:hypothetical protein n=1 Tax=Thermobacillus sp. TaxID=2108467 RepID=UPI002580DB0B|nr:hypothetical protein [Thermobacillus sp.]